MNPGAFILHKIRRIKMIVGKFAINGTDYVVVKMESATHVMPKMDWKKVYGKLHPEKWNRK